MNRSWLGMAAFVLAAALASPAAAQTKQLGSDASSQDFIRALTPAPGAPALKFRGLRVLNSNPSAEPEAAAPAVAVDIKFALNSAELSEPAKETIKQIAAAMGSSQLSHFHFLVEGHTDTTGRAAYNLALSERRAQSVRAYLIKAYHIPAAKLEAVGRGEAQLLDPANPTSAVNRRVKIVNAGE